MPNFWTTTTQAIYEAFNGPRTVDVEFDTKVKELKKVVKEMKEINGILRSLPARLEPFRGFCNGVCKALTNGYPKECNYSQVIKSIVDEHAEMEKKYFTLKEDISKIKSASNTWQNLFKEVNEQLDKRETARKTYDHYDEKLEDLVKERNKKMDKGKDETHEEMQKFDRVSNC